MAEGTDAAILILGLLGGGALGAALGGLIGGFAQWRGVALAIAVGAFTALGAGAGLIVTGDVRPPDLGALIARAGESRQERRLMAVLKAHYPDDYTTAEASLTALHANHANPAQVEAEMNRLGLPLMERQIPLADTKTALALARLSREQQKVLAQNPQLCFRAMIDPGPETLKEVEAATPPDLRTRAGELAVDLLEQTALHPQPPRQSEDIDKKARLWMMDSFGSLSFQDRDLLKTMSSTPTDEQAAIVCRVYGNMLDMLLFASRDDGAEVYKTLTAKGMSRLTN